MFSLPTIEKGKPTNQRDMAPFGPSPTGFPGILFDPRHRGSVQSNILRVIRLETTSNPIDEPNFLVYIQDHVARSEVRINGVREFGQPPEDAEVQVRIAHR